MRVGSAVDGFSRARRNCCCVLAIGDLLAFQSFLRMAATRTGQLLNLSQLGADAGVSHNTAKSWLGVLEASYIATRVPPFFRNLGKRLVKTPKLHFLDTGLACYLLGIRSAQELRAHPLRGAIFESFIASEAIKAQRNHGAHANVWFFRDAHGLEVDLLIERGASMAAVEAKSGATVPLDAFEALDAVARLIPEIRERVIVHGGAQTWSHKGARAVSYLDLDSIDLGGTTARARPPNASARRRLRRP